jgi:hypothetical protein
VLTDQICKHNVSQKGNDLHIKASSEWEEEDYRTYEKLHSLITEVMLYAERQTTSRFTKTYEWSPILIKAVYAERYWRLAYKRSIGRFVSDEYFNRIKNSAGITLTPVSFHLPYILQCLNAARETRKLLQKIIARCDGIIWNNCQSLWY